jgi:hypothetical protein
VKNTAVAGLPFSSDGLQAADTFSQLADSTNEVDERE